MAFDINRFRQMSARTNRFERRLNALRDDGKATGNIEETVASIRANLASGSRSFVVYGEPQSGKTELMIALTAALLDDCHRIIIVLLNDSLQLLSQNLDRFKRSGLDPAPCNFSELLDPVISPQSGEWVIFCKKNQADLRKLSEKLSGMDEFVIIDDEADYATPNSKVNQKKKTTINQLVEGLIRTKGRYIGVTATPARLDLNNTFNNEKEMWVLYRPHDAYHGHRTFFPVESSQIASPDYRLTLLPDTHDAPKYIREALFRFLLSVGYLNREVNNREENFSMLIHTSGKRADHTEDYKNVVKTLAVLSDKHHRSFAGSVESLWNTARARHGDLADELVEYVLRNIGRHSIVVMNSDIDKKTVDFNSATRPAALFTIAIGGNIVSRGVTFENLLSMYFTRDVKHKIQQDTYIQRARMFGNRGGYLEHFELTIPDQLYADWHRCFIFHYLALESIRSGSGSPVWLADRRISVVASSSVDKATVTADQGEMGFAMFDFDSVAVEDILEDDHLDSLEKLIRIRQLVGNNGVPEYLIRYISSFSPDGSASLAVHPPRDMTGYRDANPDRIERRKGFMGESDLERKRYPKAVHHVKIFHNGNARKARLYYKYDGGAKFIRNLRT